MPSFQQLTNWTNTKACLAGAGEVCYKNDGWHRFSICELRQHIGLYIWNGLNPSPRVEWKFSPQAKDPLHGSDFIHASFRKNVERRHRHFKVRCSLFFFFYSHLVNLTHFLFRLSSRVKIPMEGSPNEELVQIGKFFQYCSG